MCDVCVKCEEVRFVLFFSLPIQSGVVTFQHILHHHSNIVYLVLM